MGTHWLLIPAPEWLLVTRLADRYERTGEGESKLAEEFERTLELSEVLVDYAVALAGRPSQS